MCTLTENTTIDVNASTGCHTELKFKKITIDDMPLIMKYISQEDWRTTDFSYGGILMWVDYFHYEYCIYNDTLFIKGRLEDHRNCAAFSVPIGAMSIAESVDLLKNYCQHHHHTLRFSAVPKDVLPEFEALMPTEVTLLADWGDYLYEASALAELKGKKMSKKRNHVNRFMAEYPDHKLVPITADNVSRALRFMDRYSLEADHSPSADSEMEMTREILRLLPMCQGQLHGAMLMVGDTVAGITVADTIGDTMFVHIEKALREISGSYEAINCLFAKEMTTLNPDIKYINREDDAGDPGLRQAKLSYHPVEILEKYNITF